MSDTTEHAKLLPISSFTGPLLYKDTGKPKMCDCCGTERAMWAHMEEETKKRVYLCFGCGDH